MAILAAGVGFAIRNGILDNWGAEYGFSGLELGQIFGASFSSFCFGIIIGGIICDKVGYGKLVILAFILHALSAVVTFAPTPEMSKEVVYWLLFSGMFLFGYANGTLEAVANPLVATLFPEKRTHYLNILHASWPAGMVIGMGVGWYLDDALHVSWKIQLALFLIPTVIYGILFIGQRFPKSEASQKGLGLSEMFKDVGMLGAAVICFLLYLFFPSILPEGLTWLSAVFSIGLLAVVAYITRFSIGAWLLFALFIAHALIGSVELGTDGWITNITGNILSSGEGKALFIWAASIMFVLRFSADLIQRKLGLSPIGILLTCSVLAVIGLNMASHIETFWGAVLALGVYGVGKTFFWPTMLAVTSDRFPRTGAVAISMMGGIGMLSVGVIGGPGLGYAKDRFAGEALKAANESAFVEFKSEKPSSFFPVLFEPSHGIDGIKFGAIKQKAEHMPDAISAAEQAVLDATIQGDRDTLVADSIIPLAMAIIYLILLLYFRSIGGYKVVTIGGKGS